jgi:hypothetical protein
MEDANAMVATMTLPDAPHWTDVVTAVATAVMAIAALGALCFARRQLREAQNATKERNASAVYRSLLEKALEYPDFVAPDPSDVNLGEGTFRGERGEFRRYEQFIDLMLTSFEEVIKLRHRGKFELPCKGRSEGDGLSDSYINGWLFDHRVYLQSKYFEQHFRTMVSDELWERIRNATDPANAEPATTGGHG